MAFFTKMQHSHHALWVGSLLLGTWDNSFNVFRRCLSPYPTCLCLFQTCLCLCLTCLCIFSNLSLSLPNSDQIYWIFDSFPDYLFLRPGGKLVRRRSQLLSSNFFGGLIILLRIKKNVKWSLERATEGVFVERKNTTLYTYRHT